MKKVSYLFLCGLLSIVALSFNSCSDDDGVGSSNDLIGTWELVSNYGWYKEDDELYEWEDEEINELRLVFYADGTYEFYEYDDYDRRWYLDQEGTWQYKGGKLYTYDYDGDLDDCITVTSLSSSSFTIEQHGKEQYEGVLYEYYESATYRKISD